MALEEYRRKRDFTKTTEPSPGKARSHKGGLAYLIQKHDATRLHYQEITVKGCFHHTPWLIEQALDLLAAGVVDGGALIDDRIGLAEVEDGLRRMARSEVIKLAVLPELA